MDRQKYFSRVGSSLASKQRCWSQYCCASASTAACSYLSCMIGPQNTRDAQQPRYALSPKETGVKERFHSYGLFGGAPLCGFLWVLACTPFVYSGLAWIAAVPRVYVVDPGRV